MIKVRAITFTAMTGATLRDAILCVLLDVEKYRPRPQVRLVFNDTIMAIKPSRSVDWHVEQYYKKNPPEPA